MPKPNISYKILKEYLENNPPVGGEIKSPRDISDAVTHIRKSKLPDPKILGNAGSFFKNVFLARQSLGEGGVKSQLEELLEKYPKIPYFEESASTVKIPAGWLIEQCGPANGTSWKGCRIGNVGAHEKQALVLVNYGGATGKEIMELADKITVSVKEKFGLELALEVNLI